MVLRPFRFSGVRTTDPSPPAHNYILEKQKRDTGKLGGERREIGDWEVAIGDWEWEIGKCRLRSQELEFGDGEQGVINCDVQRVG